MKLFPTVQIILKEYLKKRHQPFMGLIGRREAARIQFIISPCKKERLSKRIFSCWKKKDYQKRDFSGWKNQDYQKHSFF